SAAQPHVKYLTNYSSVAHPPLDSALCSRVNLAYLLILGLARDWGMLSFSFASVVNQLVDCSFNQPCDSKPEQM
ncbi:hypothetical protein, partial [Corynebacterium sp. KPL2699]|uniref:hypothetical protein n=1 Tax=Corynebacterium sp. KPL2699 TaxID=3158311 RepID=UPI0032EBC61E